MLLERRNNLEIFLLIQARRLGGTLSGPGIDFFLAS